MKVIPTMGVLCVVLCASIANASDKSWSLGASAAFELFPYKGTDSEVLPFPMVGYESEHFFVRGPAAGAYLWKGQQDQLSLNIFYSPLHFNPNKSDDRSMKALDKRHSTMMAGIAYRYSAGWGAIRTSFSSDVLDTSNGLYADAAYLYSIKINKLRLTPGIGVSWYNSDFNNYYYGITHNESRRSGLAQYDAKSSWSPYIELSAHYSFNDKWSAFASGRYIHLGNEVKDSPMVDNTYSAVIATGITYRF